MVREIGARVSARVRFLLFANHELVPKLLDGLEVVREIEDPGGGDIRLPDLNEEDHPSLFPVFA